MGTAVNAFSLVFAMALLGCDVGETTLCMDLSANALDSQSGCVSHDSIAVPAERCVVCQDQGCGIDLSCEKSSCVVGPGGAVYLVFCLDASLRAWPEGWRAIDRLHVTTDPALTEAQRKTCLSMRPYELFCLF